jgi:hypothetical protein
MWLDHSVATPTTLILRDREAIVSKDDFGARHQHTPTAHSLGASHDSKPTPAHGNRCQFPARSQTAHHEHIGIAPGCCDAAAHTSSIRAPQPPHGSAMQPADKQLRPSQHPIKHLNLLQRRDIRRQDFTRPRPPRLGNWARADSIGAAYANRRRRKQTRC